MATKKKGIVSDLENLDYMSIISGGSNDGVFSRNKTVDYSYKTGIPILDYMYGYEVVIRDNGEFVRKKLCLGLQAGSFNVLTGRTQSFKTTIATQIISNIAYSNNGNIVHYDAEQRLVLERAKNLSKLPDNWFTGENPRYSLRSGAIGFDTLQNDITTLYENKMRNAQYLLEDTGEVDSNNQPIFMMPPTVVFLDSLQNVIQEEKNYDVENKKFDDNKELRGNMYGAQSAKTIRGFLTDILPMIKEANIIFIVIAHKTSNMSLNPFAGVKKQFQYGSNDERISGGSAVEFNASAVINLNGLVGNDTRFNMESDGFEGNTVIVEPVKSSTNESGNEKTGLGFEIIVDKRKNGVDNIRTLICFMKKKGRLKGNAAGYKVINKHGEELTDKFTWKHCYDEFKKDSKTFNTFMVECKKELETLISRSDETASGTIDPFDMDKFTTEIVEECA